MTKLIKAVSPSNPPGASMLIRRMFIVLGSGLVIAAGAAWWYFSSGKDTHAVVDHSVAAKADETSPAAINDPPGTIRLSATQQNAIGLRTHQVSAGSTSHVVTAPGKVAPNETQFAFISPRASGVVRSVTARIGQDVKAGDLLATIDSAIVGDARLQLYSQLQALDLANTQADWQETIYRNTLDLVEHLKRGESPQQLQESFSNKAVGENRERLLTAYAQYRLALATIERNKELFAQKLITPKQFEQVNANYEVAQATYQSLMDQMGFETKIANIRAQQARKQAETAVRAAQERLRILGVKADGTEPEIQQGKVIGVKPDGTLNATQLDETSLAENPDVILTHEDHEFHDAETAPPGAAKPHHKTVLDAPVSTYSIWAPFSGTVLDREMIVPGVNVDPTHRIFTLANLSSVYVEANIHEHDFDVLAQSQGGTIQFRTPAYPGREFEGVVIYSGDLVEETSRTVKLLAKAPNPERLLKPGMFVTVEIFNPTARSGMQVPASAIVVEENQTSVFVRTGPETFVQREIVTEPARDDHMLVQKGLNVDEEIVTEGVFKLKSIASYLSKPES